MSSFSKFIKKNVAVIAVCAAALLLLGGVIAAIALTPQDIVRYEIRFDSNMGERVEPIRVLRGRRITSLPTPTRLDENNQPMTFLGWYKDDGVFEYPWELDYDIVTEDIRLYAAWHDPKEYPTEINLQKKAFASSLTWHQIIDPAVTDFNVYLNGEPAPAKQVDNKNFSYNGTEVRWTPYNFIGDCSVRIETKINGVVNAELTRQRTRAVTFRQFTGTGIQSDPYIIISDADIDELNKYNGEVGKGEYFALNGDITASSASETSSFSGNFDGKGYTITVTGKSGFFHRINEGAIVANFTTEGIVEDLIHTAPTADYNSGIIENVQNNINVSRPSGVVGDISTKDDGLLGGIARINEESGIIRNCRNGYSGIRNSSGDKLGAKINAYIGGGGIVGENHGLIEGCINYGRLGSRANYETGKTVAYSYLGGIAGFNYGTITKSINMGSMFAQRGKPDSNNNKAFGGIVGYNEGTITECVQSGERIHADEFVGGIAGINAGEISYSYVRIKIQGDTSDTQLGTLMIGGRTNVGGIAGKIETNSVINACYFIETPHTFNRSYTSSPADANKSHTMGMLFAANGTAYLIAERSTNCVYNDTLSGTVDPVTTLLAPQGSGNIKGTVADNLTLLDNKFTANGKLLWQ